MEVRVELLYLQLKKKVSLAQVPQKLQPIKEDLPVNRATCYPCIVLKEADLS